jgi:alpha-glucosidase (family GH31 glycosyl hydrolase)
MLKEPTMNAVPGHLVPDFTPIADPTALVTAPNLRVTVLTERLLRIEYSPTDRFEDRPSQPFWHRLQPVPDFEVQREDEEIRIQTRFLTLSYRPEQGLRADTLSVRLKESDTTWHYGDHDSGNLLGTYRTLDRIDGGVPLEPGLLSRSGWTLVDDSQTLVFDDSGWLAPRQAPQGQRDLYFFGYGLDFKACLADYRLIAGPVPLLPRWALGNWWSRYWPYSDLELRQLILDFEAHLIPLSVCIIDMEWHLTETGNQSSGWTGYTWNRELFPEPEATIRFLHEHGLRTALNLHPAEGIHPHEEQYADFARHMGLDPASGQPIPFNLADKRFTEAYFTLLHHPEEQRGVDFWWLDWQQGTLSGMPGLDPLWWLNHLHFNDLARPTDDGSPAKRPFVFSRWGGLGNHRYPIGFSGDTVISWETLAFQPYFTSTAANVAYDWWSHDIGGHYHGFEDPELYTRWVQYGLLSPILRLHSTKNAQLERRPFGWDAETLRLTRLAMQMRHRLIPYLYSMSWRDHAQAETPFRPMYHDYPDQEAAYFCPDQYTFGSELIAAPYLSPRDPETKLARQLVWLPTPAWHFFDGRFFPAGHHALHGSLEDVPLFARPGAIVPLCEPDDWQRPGSLDIHVFPGESNRFEMYEDDGTTIAFQDGAFTLTTFDLSWEQEQAVFSILPGALINKRRYTLHFRALHEPAHVSARLNGFELEQAWRYDASSQTLTLTDIHLDPGDHFACKFQAAAYENQAKLAELKTMVGVFHMNTTAKEALNMQLANVLADPMLLAAYRPGLKERQMRAMLEVICEAGLHHVTHASQEHVLLWNRNRREDVRYQLSREHLHRWLPAERFQLEQGQAPDFRGWTAESEFKDTRWRLRLDYGDMLSVEEA